VFEPVACDARICGAEKFTGYAKVKFVEVAGAIKQ
jgi:hypothetical protein